MLDALISDLDDIIAASEDDLRSFSDSRLYVTGGTGFLGSWLLRTFSRANRRLGTSIRLDVLTRDPERFRAAHPDLAADEAIHLLRGDVVSPVVDGLYDGVIHAAATSGAVVSPSETLRTIVDGTRAVFRDVVGPNGKIPVLLISTGAVYGGSTNCRSFKEDDYGYLNHLDVRYTYHESKRLAELCVAVAHNESSSIAKIARLFAFLGPGLPLNAHFAAGNFIRDALVGGPIRIKSGGGAIRTFMYPTDMIVWCLAIFTRGVSGRAYNVGSDDAVSIRALAERIAGLVVPSVEVSFRTEPSSAPETRYVPNLRRIRDELGVDLTIDLDQAILRTISFYRAGASAARA